MDTPLFLSYGEIQRIRERYPGRIPIFVTRASNANIPDIPKKKYLAPAHISVGQFIYVIRKQINLAPEQALFIFVDNTLPAASTTLAEVYDKHKSLDGALRMVYTSESTFGI